MLKEKASQFDKELKYNNNSDICNSPFIGSFRILRLLFM